MGCVHHSIPHKELTKHLLCGVPGHTVGLLESNQTVKETVAEMYGEFSKAIMLACVRPLASLGSEERKVPEAICCCGRHGNNVIHMRTKFHLHACCS